MHHICTTITAELPKSHRPFGGNETTNSFFDTYTTNDIITVRYNVDANELNFLKNNSATGSTISTVVRINYILQL